MAVIHHRNTIYDEAKNKKKSNLSSQFETSSRSNNPLLELHPAIRYIQEAKKHAKNIRQQGFAGRHRPNY
jgi:hypothetical protein